MESKIQTGNWDGKREEGPLPHTHTHTHVKEEEEWMVMWME